METQKLQEKIDQEEQWLRSVVIPEIIKSKKFEILDADEISIGRIEIKFIGSEEAFMLTICYRATVELSCRDKKHQRCLVVKKTPQFPPEIFDAINFGALFNNEILAYSSILPSIENFTKQAFEVPKFYYGDFQKYFGTIVLEDFGVDGWRVPKERYNLSLEHILTAVNYIGEFHGFGFAMRAVKREEFDAIQAKLKEPHFDSQYSDDWARIRQLGIKRLLKATREHEPSISEKFLEKLARMLSTDPAYGKQLVAPREPFITLCHGDFLRNNIAFKYQNEATEAKPIKSMMFDLQTLRVSSPMVDLTILLSLSAFTEVRHKNFELIFNSYCDALTKSYETYAHQKAPAYFSHDSLLREFIFFMPYAVHIASFFLLSSVEPDERNAEELLQAELTEEEATDMAMNRGGDVVDSELSHQVKELFDLTQQYGVDIFKDFTF